MAAKWEEIEKRGTERGKLASSVDVGMGIILFFTCFVFGWKATWGGYVAGMPIAIGTFFFLFKRKPWGYTLSVLKENLKELVLKENRKYVIFIISWQIRQVFNLVVPRGGGGSPRSLILFSIVFSLFFAPADKRAYKKGNAGKWLVTRLSYIILTFFFILGLVFLDDSILTYTVDVFGKEGQCNPLLGDYVSLYGNDAPKKASAFVSTFMEVVDFVSSLGEVPRILPAVIFLFGATQFFVSNRYRELKDMFYLSVKCLVYGGLSSAIMKITFHRYRPNAFRDAFVWMGPRIGTVDHYKFSKLDKFHCSFPCGHTTVATAVAFVLASKLVEFLKKSRPNASPWLLRLLIVIIYTFPAIITMARVIDCVHWPSDAIFGVILGIQVGKLVMWLSYSSKEEDTKGGRVKIMNEEGIMKAESAVLKKEN